MDLGEEGDDTFPLMVHVVQPPQVTTANDLPDFVCHALTNEPQTASFLHEGRGRRRRRRRMGRRERRGEKEEWRVMNEQWGAEIKVV